MSGPGVEECQCLLECAEDADGSAGDVGGAVTGDVIVDVCGADPCDAYEM